ncbi:MAG: hypothetical protein JXB35_00795 [Anaerolineae bacterium]|nr:hypothetical protein [Anaerolineae bacterium]
MKRTWVTIILIVSALLLGLGLLFLCAAIREPRRLPLTMILLGLGGAGAFWSGRTLQRLRSQTPEVLAERITALARAGNAEVTLPQIVAELTVPHDAAIAALNTLERRGECQRDVREDREVYVFPGLQPSLVVRRCPYCGSEFSVKQALYKCPQCGGDLTLERH